MIDYTNTLLHFKLGKEIGSEGKNSQVFVAHDWQLDAEIVVKRVQKAAFSSNAEFFNEAKILYASSHSNIAPIQYATQDDDYIYISMPLFEKGSLNQLIEKRHLSIREILKYSIDFLSGLHHIHSMGLVHCDIKPTNILISDSNDAVLTDFGLAKYLNEYGLATIDMLYGWHQAPELTDNNTINHQNDIYQAGLTIYRLCNGNKHFKEQLNKYLNPDSSFNQDKFENAILKGTFPDRSLYLHYIPQTLRNAIRKALEPNPTDRYSSILDFLNDLANIEVPYDWAFYPEDSSSYWHCICNNKEYKMTITELECGNFELYTTKKVLSSEREQRIVDYCHKKANLADVNKTIRAFLHNKSL